MSLADLISEEISRSGAISFYDFMELCLYYPGQGYYNTLTEKIGKRGDFYTSTWFTSAFGEMIARQMTEMWQLLDRRPFTIVEYGAGTGSLCRDILHALEAIPEMYAHLRYFIIEKGEGMRQLQSHTVPDQVQWVNAIGELPPIDGCVFSNELVDNFSVHRVVMQQELMEVFVDCKEGVFTECLYPARPALNSYLQELNIVLPPGFQTEINLETIPWISDISQSLRTGFLLTIDYGYPSAILYCNTHRTGTLACYYKHTVNTSPYEHIGEQDITSHVNFSALKHWGDKAGLAFEAFTNQAHFLRGLGFAAHLRMLEEQLQLNNLTPEEKQSIIRTMLLDMGSKFMVLAQSKGIKSGNNPEPNHFSNRLSGFRITLPLG